MIRIWVRMVDLRLIEVEKGGLKKKKGSNLNGKDASEGGKGALKLSGWSKA